MSGFKSPIAIGGMVIVSPDKQDTDEEGRQIDLSSGLYLGRNVDLPTGRIVSIGPDAQRLMQVTDGNGEARACRPGDRLIFERDKTSEIEYAGQTLNLIKVDTDCPYCGSSLLKDGIIGIQGE